jgi:hypothetical protein
MTPEPESRGCALTTPLAKVAEALYLVPRFAMLSFPTVGHVRCWHTVMAQVRKVGSALLNR